MPAIPALMRVLFLAVLLPCFAAGCVFERSSASLPVVSSRIQGVTLDAPRAPEAGTFAALAELGATHVALVPYAFQEALHEPVLTFSRNARWYSENEGGVRSIAREVAAFGMDVILKPQVWLRGGVFTAHIDFELENDWESWERDYRAYTLSMARLAEEIGADLFVVGTELATPVRKRPEFWRGLIREVRDVYGGQVTYAANWYDDYEHVTFWEELDFIGVQAYFPIARSDAPDASDLRDGWAEHARRLERVSRREGRPILFTEIGYRSVPYAAREPWTWPSRSEETEPDFQLQADLFAAFFDAVWRQSWFKGVIIWKFYPENGRRGRRLELDFTPQNKPAEDVIRAWFGG